MVSGRNHSVVAIRIATSIVCIISGPISPYRTDSVEWVNEDDDTGIPCNASKDLYHGQLATTKVYRISISQSVTLLCNVANPTTPVRIELDQHIWSIKPELVISHSGLVSHFCKKL